MQCRILLCATHTSRQFACCAPAFTPQAAPDHSTVRCRATPQRPARPQLLFCLVRSSALSAQGASLVVVGCDTAGNNKRGVVFVFARGTASATIGGGAAQERWWQTQALRIDDDGVSSISDGYAAVQLVGLSASD